MSMFNLENKVNPKIIDKVVCIDIIPDEYDWIVDLTLGKVYDVNKYEVSVGGQDIIIVNDDNGSFYYYKASRFISLDKYRESIINNILDL